MTRRTPKTTHEPLPVDIFDAIAQGREAEWRAAQGNQKNQPPALTTQAQAATESVANLPTQKQVMHLACVMVAQWLRMGIGDAISARNWRDELGDSVNAAELALAAVERLTQNMPPDLDGFEPEWCRVGGVVRLVVSWNVGWRLFRGFFCGGAGGVAWGNGRGFAGGGGLGVISCAGAYLYRPGVPCFTTSPRATSTRRRSSTVVSGRGTLPSSAARDTGFCPASACSSRKVSNTRKAVTP